MEKQGNIISQKVNNSTTMDSNDSEVDEIPDKELKRIITRMINEIEEDTCNHLNLFKENTNKLFN
jgi:hypothetical protein